LIGDPSTIQAFRAIGAVEQPNVRSANANQTTSRLTASEKGRVTMKNDTWEGIVIKKSRGLLDGSNMYHRLRIRLTNGSVTKIRVSRDLWNSVTEGDRVTKAAGQDPVKR
jgi:hypothetical protein